MENDKTYVRRTISISPYIDETIEVLSRSEFGENASAFIAHSILHYIRCQRCALNNSENDSDNASNMPVQGKSLPRPHWQAPFYLRQSRWRLWQSRASCCGISVASCNCQLLSFAAQKNIFCAAGDIKVLSFMDRNFVYKRILLGKIPLILPQAILSVKNPNHKFKGSSGKRKWF